MDLERELLVGWPDACELCEAEDVPLRPTRLAGAAVDHFLCATCRADLRDFQTERPRP